MTAESLNTQLAQIYQTYTQSIYSEKWEDNVSAPLLMHVYDEYVTMDRKILFVGQETHSWGKMGEGSVEFLQAKYRDFNLGKSADYETRSLFAICEARSGISTGPCFTAVTTLTHR